MCSTFLHPSDHFYIPFRFISLFEVEDFKIFQLGKRQKKKSSLCLTSKPRSNHTDRLMKWDRLQVHARLRCFSRLWPIDRLGTSRNLCVPCKRPHLQLELMSMMMLRCVPHLVFERAHKTNTQQRKLGLIKSTANVDKFDGAFRAGSPHPLPLPPRSYFQRM
jgi:hypothetical protein